jgi:hypothetical protein
MTGQKKLAKPTTAYYPAKPMTRTTPKILSILSTYIPAENNVQPPFTREICRALGEVKTHGKNLLGQKLALL